MVENGKSGGAVAGVLSQRIYREIFNMEAGLNTRITRLGSYAGNFEAFEKIETPEGGLYTLNNNDEGETGNEVDDVHTPKDHPVRATPDKTLLPSIAPTPDQPKDEN